MQTFLPDPSFTISASQLDYRRLGKQRVECLQLLNAIAGRSTGWRNHPATRMWRPHADHLQAYGLVMCDEWIQRGYRDTTRPKIAAFVFQPSPPPPWIGGPIHRTHRIALLTKDPVYYSRHGWAESPNPAYIYHWPV